MKRTIWIIALAALLLMLTACGAEQPSTPRQDTQTPAEATEETTDETQDATQQEPPTVVAEEPAPSEPEAEIIATIPWTLPGCDITVNVPEVWNEGTELIQLLTESPDVNHYYAVTFAPKGIELTQDANIGFFYIVTAGTWDAQDGRITDIAVNEIGRSGEYVVGYSGSSDNPYVLGTEACELYDKMLTPTKGAMNILSVAEN